MITEALGINYYVIGPSLCLLMTGVLFIISDLSLNLKTRYLGIVLTTGIFFTGVTIYLKIGEFARIGANTVVLKDVADHATMVGNPAKNIRIKTDDDFKPYGVINTDENE